MIISPNKKYSKLYSVGCSYTNGYKQGELAQWSKYLSNRLNCGHHIIDGVNASSNNYIYSKIINFCENQKEKDFCIAIQWSEFSRREIYIQDVDDYIAFNLNGLIINDEFNHDEFYFLKKHFEKIDKMFFNIDDMVWRTVNAMISTISYLRENNIDFIMFQGINSILDFNNSDNKNFPLSNDIKENILNQPEFFNKYGDMHTHMRNHELFNQDNEGHPNSKYIKWWANEMYNYILEKNV